MNYRDFERVANDVFDAIPERFREGVDGLEITRATVPHPTLPDVYTLGECITDSYPTEFGGPGDVRSVVALYYGSFLALSRLNDDWDWEEEIYETVTHEVQHHLESLASDESLEVQDYAEDQNFARREGEPFDPYFFRAGHAAGPGVWEIDRDHFIEVPFGSRELAEGSVRVEWEGESFPVALAAEQEDVRLEPLREREDGSEVIAVLVRRRGLMEWIRGLLARRPPASNLRTARASGAEAEDSSEGDGR